MASGNTVDRSKPNYVSELESVFGEPNQSGFGSAVFFIPIDQQSDRLESDAQATYRFFVGESWERFGEAAWMSTWTSAYSRTLQNTPDIIAELRGLSDREARQSAGLLLESQENAHTAEEALKQAFDQPQVEELGIFKIGDGEAISGVIIAARISNAGTLALILLLD